ncbi:MAG: ATP-binding protein [Candidatus Limnocylindrales bacterium]
MRTEAQPLTGVAPRALDLPPAEPNLLRRYLVANLILLIAGGSLIGIWVGDQLQRGILDRSASITALYVDSFIEPHLATLQEGDWLPDDAVAALDSLVDDSQLEDRIVTLKIWARSGTVVYSGERELIGQTFPLEERLLDTFEGQVVASVSDLSDPENVAERQFGDHLVEMYVPVRERGTDRVIAVAEFYQLPTELDHEVSEARMRSWLIVSLGVALSFILIYAIVRLATQTIARQQGALRAQVGELSALLDENARLSDRVRTAAARNTTLNERALRRISADLHDGPGQALALALLRLDSIDDHGADHAAIEEALQDALRDTRAIAAGLRLPELAELSVQEAAKRAVDDHVRRTGAEVGLTVGKTPAIVALPVKIALYRALQELLSNGSRHGKPPIAVDVGTEGRLLRLTVSDGGPGFDDSKVGEDGHLGLAGVREQAELLGGSFEVSGLGTGTAVIVRWHVAP